MSCFEPKKPCSRNYHNRLTELGSTTREVQRTFIRMHYPGFALGATPLRLSAPSSQRAQASPWRMQQGRRGRGRGRGPVPQETDEEWSPERLGFTEVGVILGAHGVRGDIRVRSVGEFGQLRLGGKKGVRYLLRPGRKFPRPVAVARGRRAPQSGVWIMHVAEAAGREEAARLRGCRLFVKDGDSPSVDEGEFLVGELVGLDVQMEGTTIGVVRGVITRDEVCSASGSGKKAEKVANDVLEVALVEGGAMKRNTFDELNRTGEDASDDEVLEKATCVLIPFVHQIVPLVDVEKGMIEIDPPEGLLDIAVVNRKENPKPPRGLLTACAEN